MKNRSAARHQLGSVGALARRWLFGIAVLVSLLTAYLVLVPRPAAPVRLGLLANLSGHGGTAGEYIREGTMLAVEELNASGGVQGRPLELLIRDDRNSKDGVEMAARELVDAGVLVIIGPVTSQNSLYAHPVVTSRGVLLFTPYSATSKLSRQDDLFFRTAVDTTRYGGPTAHLLEGLEARTTAFLMDISNPSFVEDYLERTAADYGGEARPVRIDPKQGVDWESVLAELLTPMPDAVVLLTEASVTGIAAQKLRAAGFAGPMIATLWAQTPDLPRYGGAAVEGLSLVTFIDPVNTGPERQRFSQQMLERLGKPANARSVRAYEAVQIIAEALKRVPSPITTDGLKQALLAGRFDTLMGTIRFDRYGDVDRPIFEVKIQDDRYVRVRQLP